MRPSLVLLVVLAACAGSPDNGVLLIGDSELNESRGHCWWTERCAMATGTTAVLLVENGVSDIVQAATVTAAAVDRPELAVVTTQPQTVTMHARAAGHTRLTVDGTADSDHGPGLVAVRGVRNVEIVDATERIVVRGDGSAEPAPLTRVRAHSNLVLRLDRLDGAGEPLLGDNGEPWTIDAVEATLEPTGATGLLQVLHAGEPEIVTVRVGGTSATIEIVAP